MPNLPYSTTAWTTHSQVGTTKFDFPFPDDPSIYTVTRTYEGPLSTYAAPTMLAADATYTSHYLVAQSPFEALDGGCIRYTRTWAPVPAARTIYGALGLNRPNLHNIKSGSFYGVSFDDGASSWLYSARKTASAGTISAPTTTITTGASSFPSATFTFTRTGYGDVTFNLTDSADTIRSAFNSTWGSSPAVSVVVKSYASIKVVFVSAPVNVQNLSCSAAGVATEYSSGILTITTSSASNVESPNLAASVRTINATSHGGTAGNRVALYNGDRIVALSKVIAVATNDFTILAADLPGKDDVVTNCVFDKDGLRVANGLDSVSTKIVTTWALPGVTAGIASPADISLSALQITGPDWLAALTATSLSSVTATASNDRLTKTAHGLSTGETFFLTSTGSGTAGLATLTQYFAIKVDADNFKAATSQALALAGTAVDITADGTGLTVVVPAPWPVVETPGLERWLGSGIYARTTISAQMADAFDQLTATA